MAMMMNPNCPCCNNFLHHCKKCWDKYHNGQRDNDYIPPKFYGELLNGKDWEEFEQWIRKNLLLKTEKLQNIIIEDFKKRMRIMPDKTLKYIEGDYNH